MSSDSDSSDTKSEKDEEEDESDDEESSDSEESESSEEEKNDEESDDDDSTSDESDEDGGRKPSQVARETIPKPETTEEGTQTEAEFDKDDSTGKRPECTEADFDKDDSTGKRPECKDASCGSECVTNSQESQTDDTEMPYVSKDKLAQESDLYPVKESEELQQKKTVPMFSAPPKDLRDTESMTDVQLGPRQSYAPFPKPEQRESATGTDVSVSSREIQTDDVSFQSPESISEQRLSSEIDRVPSSLKKEDYRLLTNANSLCEAPLENTSAIPFVHVPRNAGQDRGVQVDIPLKSRRVRTQTKVKRHEVQTLTSGLIKQVNMQTYTSGLISKSDHSTNTVNMNIKNMKIKNRKTQTEEHYFSGTTNEKHGEENGTLNNIPKLNLTNYSPESTSSFRASKGKEMERKINKSSTKEVRQPRYRRPKSASEQDSESGKEEKKQQTDTVFKQDLGSGDEKKIDKASKQNSESRKRKKIDKASKQDSGSEEEERRDSENWEKNKTDKERKNFRRRRRRKRELYFLPIQHPSSDFRPKSSNQKRSRTRPKSSGSLPKKKSVEQGNARPLSCAQYRMLYHHRWAEIPF